MDKGGRGVPQPHTGPWKGGESTSCDGNLWEDKQQNGITVSLLRTLTMTKKGHRHFEVNKG